MPRETFPQFMLPPHEPFLQNGIGFPNPSLVSILRRTPGGGQVVIRVDLNRALRPAQSLHQKGVRVVRCCY